MNRSSALAPLMASSTREAQPLLSPTTSKVQITSTHPCHCPTRYLCLPSKAAILILLLTSIVGVMSCVGVVALGLLHVNNSNWNAHISSVNTSLLSSLPYAFFALMMMFYPLSGFIADVCCGRFKTVVVSLIIFTISILLFSFTCILLKVYAIQLVPPFSHNWILTIFCIILLLSALFISIIGLAGYQANFIQFGLDQLLEAPSEYLGLFVHWAKWIYDGTSKLVYIYLFVYVCRSDTCLLYTSPSPRDATLSRMPSSA